MSALTIELEGIAAGGATAADLPELAAVHSRMGADGVEIGRDDMIGAFRQPDDIACLAFGVDELAEGVAVLGHVDRQRQLGRVDRRVGERSFDLQRSRRQGEPLGAHLGGERHSFGRAREAKGDVDDIIAGRNRQRRLRQAGFDDQGTRAVRIGLRGEDPPPQTSGQRRAAAVQDGGEAERRLGGFACWRLSGSACWRLGRFACRRLGGFARRGLGGIARRRLGACGRDQRQERDRSRQNSPRRSQSASHCRKRAPPSDGARGSRAARDATLRRIEGGLQLSGIRPRANLSS